MWSISHWFDEIMDHWGFFLERFPKAPPLQALSLRNQGHCTCGYNDALLCFLFHTLIASYRTKQPNDKTWLTPTQTSYPQLKGWKEILLTSSSTGIPHFIALCLNALRRYCFFYESRFAATLHWASLRAPLFQEYWLTSCLFVTFWYFL